MPASWEPAWLDQFAARPSEAEDPGYKIDPKSIMKLLPRLPAREQQIVDMAFFQGLSQNQIAEQLKVSQSAVSRRLRHSFDLLHYWATLPPLNLRRVRYMVHRTHRGTGRPPDVRRWMYILRALMRGETPLRIAKWRRESVDTVYRVIAKLRRYPELRPYLHAPRWRRRSGH